MSSISKGLQSSVVAPLPNSIIMEALPEKQWLPLQIRLAFRAVRSLTSLPHAREELAKSFGLSCQLLNWLTQTYGHEPIQRQAPMLQALCTVVLQELGDPVAGNNATITQAAEASAENYLLKICPLAPVFLRIVAHPGLVGTPAEFISEWQTNTHPALSIVSPAWRNNLNYTATKMTEEETALGNSNDVPVAPPFPVLTRSQTEVLALLKGFLCLRRNAREIAGIFPRCHPLITGPSGAGKTFLVKLLAAQNRLPFLDLNVSNWLVNGAMTKPHTEEVLADFVKRNAEGIIFIDEVDKIHGQQDWTRHVQQEVYALLDARMNTFPSWDEGLRLKLVSRFMIVGAGTWQNQQPSRVKEIGFGSKTRLARLLENEGEGSHALPGKTSPQQADVAAILGMAVLRGTGSTGGVNLANQQEIPEELLFRFNARIANLEPMRAAEVINRIVQICQAVGKAVPEESELQNMVADALESGRQHRWLEALVSGLLMESSSQEIPF